MHRVAWDAACGSCYGKFAAYTVAAAAGRVLANAVFQAHRLKPALPQR